MKIRILGNGGGISDGLPYNSFMIDENFLVETPPDIMNSLFREKADLSNLETLFISHFHADHYFGFPFLALRLFFNRRTTPVRIIGPAGLKEKIFEICGIAFGKDHPINNWLNEYAEFIETGSGQRCDLAQDLFFQTISMSHMIETIGFTLYLKNNAVFTYFADTVFTNSLLSYVSEGADVILTDMNGEPDDPVQVHLSERDVIEKILPHCNKTQVFYGTHLKSMKQSFHRNIRYVKAGDFIEI